MVAVSLLELVGCYTYVFFRFVFVKHFPAIGHSGRVVCSCTFVFHRLLCCFVWRFVSACGCCVCVQYRNHSKSFRDVKYSNETELSKYIWKLKTDNRAFIQWSIVKRVAPYTAGSRRCNLCLEEKLLIMKAKNKHFLNRRSEFFFEVPTCNKTPTQSVTCNKNSTT